MRFLVLAEAYETIVGREADRRLRETVAPQLQKVMSSGKVSEAGFLTDRRGAFFLIDIDSGEDLYALFGPEVYGFFRLKVSPVAALEKGAELIQQWAQEDR
jgi:hypothetical protein